MLLVVGKAQLPGGSPRYEIASTYAWARGAAAFDICHVSLNSVAPQRSRLGDPDSRTVVVGLRSAIF